MGDKIMDNTNIIDESGDKKYFTQIPNMIVNHSSAYEQSLYLIMKRIAGETGSCYASLNWLSKKMSADKKTVAKTIAKLLKRKWIKEIENKKVRGGIVRQFVVVDLWKANIKEYQSGCQVPTKESGSIIPESGSVVPESGCQKGTKKNHKKIYIKKRSSLKPFFNGMEMRMSKGKWWCLPNDGSEWLEFAGKESEIIWKTKI